MVGFFGATGSGKSSLFNAVSGEEIATAAVRRPTTSEPLAGIWGAEGSERAAGLAGGPEPAPRRARSPGSPTTAPG